MKSFNITSIILFLQNLSTNYPLHIEYKIGLLFTTVLLVFGFTLMRRISYLNIQNTLIQADMKLLKERMGNQEVKILFIITNIKKVEEVRRRKIELEEKYRDCKREANIVKKRQDVSHEYYVVKKEFANSLIDFETNKS